jgi:hypothetical protein
MQCPAIMDAALLKYGDICKDKSTMEPRPLTTEEHLNILQDGASHIDRFFVVIDAVDEITERDGKSKADVRSKVLSMLAEIGYISLLCTSRLDVLASLYFLTFSKIIIEPKVGDLRKFLDETMSNSKELQNFLAEDPSLKEKIITAIIPKSSGMFLMAWFQIEHVKSALSITQARKLLGKLSPELTDMYDMTLRRILGQPGARAELGTRAILWVANAKRPFTPSGFQHAMSLALKAKSLEKDTLFGTLFPIKFIESLKSSQSIVQQTQFLTCYS